MELSILVTLPECSLAVHFEIRYSLKSTCYYELPIQMSSEIEMSVLPDDLLGPVRVEGHRWDKIPGSLDVPCRLHLFGVNNLSTKEVLRLFEPVGGAEKCEWLDDFSCNVHLSVDDRVEDILATYPISDDHPDWRVTEPIPRESNPDEAVVLYLRRATDADKKHPNRKWQDSKFYKKQLESQNVVIVPATESGARTVVLKPASRTSVILEPARRVLLEPARRVILEPANRGRRSRSRSRDRRRSRSRDRNYYRR